MAKIYEIRTAYTGKGKKIRAWFGIDHCPTKVEELRAQANFEPHCDWFLNSEYVQYASNGEIAEAILIDLNLDACEVCNMDDIGTVVYKEWP